MVNMNYFCMKRISEYSLNLSASEKYIVGFEQHEGE